MKVNNPEKECPILSTTLVDIQEKDCQAKDESSNHFRCPICFFEFTKDLAFVLDGCSHAFCKECLIDKLKKSKGGSNVVCPYFDDDSCCDNVLKEAEINQILLPSKGAIPKIINAPKNLKCPSVSIVYISNDGVPKKEKKVPQKLDNEIDLEDNEGAVGGIWHCLKCTLTNNYPQNTCTACNTLDPNWNVIKTDNSKATPKLKSDPKIQEMNTYLDLLTLEHNIYIENTENFECPICLAEFTEGLGVILRDCLHTFCKECLAHTIEHSDEPVVRCTFLVEDQRCDGVMQDREIQGLVTPEVYKLHLDKSVRLAEAQIPNSFHCKTPDCRSWWIFEDESGEAICPVCNQLNCMTCKAIHNGMNCEQYQEKLNPNLKHEKDTKLTDAKVQAMLATGEARKCPRCQIAITKTDGCDNMTCAHCKYAFNWQAAYRRF